MEEEHHVRGNTQTNSMLKGLTNGGDTPLDNPWKDEVTNPRQGRVVGNTATLPGIMEQGKAVGSTTVEPIGTRCGRSIGSTVDPPTTMSMEEKLNIVEKLNNVEKAINKLELESRELEYTGCFAFLAEDMEKSTSPTTSTPQLNPFT